MEYQTNEGAYNLDTMVIDLNGTLTVGGEIHQETIELLGTLRANGWKLFLLTGNQRGNADMFSQYGLEIIKVTNSQEKENFILSLETDRCVAIGNARIDVGMFTHARISIATLQSEGIHADILSHIDVVVPSMQDALRLFVDKDRFAATMKI